MSVTKRMTRREFTRRAAAGVVAVPYAITSTALGGAGKAAASERVTLGHIGCGARGQATIGFFRALPDAQYVAVCDPYASRRGRMAKSLGAAPYSDLRELLARDDVDAVIVSTVDHWHVPATVQAVRAGKDVYCEKPFSLCLGWALEARRLIKRHARVFQYGTQALSYGHVRLCCELVRSGAIGELRRMEVTANGGQSGGSSKPTPVPRELDYEMWLGPAKWQPHCGQPASQDTWIYDYDYSVGWLGGMGAHALAAMQLGFDSHLAGPCTVEATGHVPRKGRYDTVTGWRSKIRFASGLEMAFNSGGQCTKFIGTDGWVIPPNVEYMVVGGQGGPYAVHPRSLIRWRPGPNDVHLGRARNGHGGDFLAAVKDRSATTVGIDIAVWSEVFVHLPDIAIRTGRKITWDPATEAILNDEEASRMLHRATREPWRV